MSWTLAALCVGAGLLVLFPAGGPAPAWARVVARLWIVAALLAPFLGLVVPVWRRTGSWLSVARAVDDRVPETEHRLLTAVDLAGALDARALPADPETQRLARAQIASALQAASRVVPEQILPVTGLPGSTLVGPALATVLICALILSPDLLDPALAALFGPAPESAAVADAADSGELPVTLTLRNLTIRLVPPAYSGRDELLLEGTTGDFQALPGTRVFLDADTSDRGKDAIVLLDGRADPFAGTLDGEHLTVEFVTGNGESYRVETGRGLGRDPLRSRTFFIERLPDHSPELEVLAPGGQLTLNADETVPLQVRTDDDFGLSRLERVILRGSEELMRQPIADVTGTASHEELIRWGPADLAGKGGEISIVVEAWDNDTVNGPKVTRSRPVSVYVPTARDLHRKVLQLKEQLSTTALDVLADLLVVNAQGTSLDDRDAILQAHDRQQVLAQEFLKVAQTLLLAMAADDLETGQTWAGVQQLVSNFDARWSTVVELIETRFRSLEPGRVHRVAVMELVTGRDSAIGELERIILDLGSFIDLHRGDDIRAELADLGNEFAQMQELLRRAQDGEIVDDDLARQMDALQERMKDLARKLAERSSGPDDGFVNQMPSELSKDAMAEVRELMAQGKFDEAMEKLRQMDEALSKMEEQLESETDQMAGAQAAAEIDAELTEAIEQARELERQQEQVLDQMGELAKQFGDEGMNEEERAALLEDMGRLREQIDALQDPDADPFVRPGVRRTAWRASQEVQQMSESFDEQRLDDAAAHGRETQDLLQEAATDLGAEARDNPEGRPARDAARAASQLAGSIAERLEQAQGRRRAQQRQAQGAGQQAAQQQGQVAQGVGDLGQKIEQMGGSAFNPARGRENLKNAEDLMRRAQGRASSGDPGRAQSAGKDGLSQLQQFRQSMEGARQSLREGGKPGGKKMAGGQGSNGPPQPDTSANGNAETGAPVELTDPDEFVGPEAYRALLQEGAQGDTPDRYKPLNGTYYEELVR